MLCILLVSLHYASSALDAYSSLTSTQIKYIYDNKNIKPYYGVFRLFCCFYTLYW